MELMVKVQSHYQWLPHSSDIWQDNKNTQQLKPSAIEANSKALESFAVGMEISFTSKIDIKHKINMELPNSVPESKSTEHLVALTDPASQTAKDGSLWFFWGGR